MVDAVYAVNLMLRAGGLSARCASLHGVDPPLRCTDEVFPENAHPEHHGRVAELGKVEALRVSERLDLTWEGELRMRAVWVKARKWDEGLAPVHGAQETLQPTSIHEELA